MYLILTTYYLLPAPLQRDARATYYLLLTAYYLLHTTYYQLHLRETRSCYLLVTAYYVLLATDYLLLTTYYQLHLRETLAPGAPLRAPPFCSK